MAAQGLSSVWDRDFPLAVQMLGSERGMLFQCSLLLGPANGQTPVQKLRRKPASSHSDPSRGWGGEEGLGRGLRALLCFG